MLPRESVMTNGYTTASLVRWFKIQFIEFAIVKRFRFTHQV
jgi:hypothetical protein